NPDEDLGDTLFPGAVVTDPDAAPEEGKFRFHARQSRLFIKTWTPTGMGEMSTHFEGDFFGGGGNEVFSNSTSFRIRHAYGEIGPWLAGQTWTNFLHFAAYPGTVDFGGPMGVSFVRQAQVRYTVPMGDGSLSFSLENPEATGFPNAQDEAPDATVRYKWSGGSATIETSAVLRRLAYDDGVDSDSEFGYGLMLAGNYSIGNTTLMGGFIYGDGVGRYLYVGSGSNNGQSGIGSAFIDDEGSLETVEAFGIVAAIKHQWTPQFSSQLAYGRAESDKPADQFPEATEFLETIHFSNFWTPVDRVTFGFEVARAAKELHNGDDGDALRVQFSTQYSF
ncbi:MAG: DcaP family trimeric outer membrane transporter, partial [Candidatus Competibacterales bacterium]|nr:DcaP family trimeric outer membrane transporter [Candidatus Competibacterales bacterium]